MKHLIIAISILFSVGVNAQTVTPRFGTGANNDNTFRTLTVNYQKPVDAAGNDTIKLNLNAWSNIVRIDTLRDSLNINFTPLTKCFYGDKVQVTVKNGANAGKVKFVGSNVEVGASGLTLSITAAKRAVIEFVFDGYKWLETNRIVQ